MRGKQHFKLLLNLGLDIILFILNSQKIGNQGNNQFLLELKQSPPKTPAGLTTMGDWSMRHFQVCILEVLRRTKIKPSSYSKLSTIYQEKYEKHSAFLTHLLEALVKHKFTAPV